MNDSNLHLRFHNYDIELANDSSYTLNSTDNSFNFDCVYEDGEQVQSPWRQHSIKIFSNEKLYRSALVCAFGSTTIHSHSAVIEGENLLICCGNKVFSLSLPGLRLNWMKEVDWAVCFRIYKADNGLFTHGESTVTRLNEKGEILWQEGLRDIIVNIEESRREESEFEIRDGYISLLDFAGDRYRLGFDGKFIGEQLNEQ